MRNAIHFLGGSIAVYTLMAACSAGDHREATKPGPNATTNAGGVGQLAGGNAATANAGTSSPSGVGGLQGAGGAPDNAGSSMGGLVDMMMDPVPDAAAETKSGTRLRARYYVGEDGSKQFIGWHDSMRDEDCSFFPAQDGKLRCTPFYLTGASTFFADMECATSPVATASKTAGAACATAVAPTKYVYLSDACGANRQRYTVASQPSDGKVYEKSGANCVDVTTALATSTDTYALVSPAPAPDSAFVAGTEQVE